MIQFSRKPIWSLAGRQGFEPRYADPESAVLPLDDLPARRQPHSERSRRGCVKHYLTTCDSTTCTILQLAPNDYVIQPAEKAFAECFGQFRDLGNGFHSGRQFVNFDGTNSRFLHVK